MTIIESQIVQPDGQGAPGWVGIRLVGPGLQPESRVSVIAPLSFRVEGDGDWSVNLLPNSSESPYYVVTESPDNGLPRQRLIHVEDTDEPQWIGSVVVALPSMNADPIFRGPEGPPGKPWTGSQVEFAAAVGDLFESATDARTAADARYERLISRDGASTGQVATLQADGSLALAAPTGGGGGTTAPNATTSTVGLVRLAGDLGGTATSPTVPGLADKASITDLSNKANATDARFTGYSAIATATDTAVTVTAAHIGRLTLLDNASAITLTVPTPTSLAVAPGQIATFMQGGNGQVTVVEGAGAAFRNPVSGATRTRTVNARFDLIALNGTTWLLDGDLVTP